MESDHLPGTISHPGSGRDQQVQIEGRRAQEPARQCWGFKPEAPGTGEGTVVESEGLDLQA